MIGLVGKNDQGQTLCQVAAQDTMDTKHVEFDSEEATGMALITVDAGGRNTIAVAPGANLALTPRHVLAAQQAFSAADVLVTQLESPLEAAPATVNLPVKNGIPVVLNPAPARPLPTVLLSSVEFFIPNEREDRQIAGVDSLEAAIQKFLELGVRHLIITLGVQGVLLVIPEGRKQIPVYRVEAIDHIAAGDAFLGAFSTGTAEGTSVEDAVGVGNEAAAVAVTRLGSQSSLPTRADVSDFPGGLK
jgi:ribokinase